MTLEVDMQLQTLAPPRQQRCSRLSPCLGLGSQRLHPISCTRRSDHPIPELPSHPGAQPVPRDRYQELVCLVANRAGVGARRSCLCACGCSGNSGPARSCQNPRWPGPSPRHSCPGAAWPAEPPLSGRASGQRGSGCSVHEHNQTGASVRTGFIAEPGYSVGLQHPLVWASRRQQEATGIQVGDLCRWPGKTKLSRGASWGWAGSIPAAAAQTAGSEPPAVLGKRQSQAAWR